MELLDENSPELIELLSSLWQSSQHSLLEFCAIYGLDAKLLSSKLAKQDNQAITFLPVI